ncbi:hypothetical protein EJ06DRAFT_137865 [Trichodelitschia bisporula]|uniref:Exonuclease domain-containing protein n=1 Tax=Trichodelitschia bisporula TaxID=703511 RepID=A0A6G1HPH1_9PEZI|nr:hypothetical protein EJ06DRAFT_137865 [Trichodelitschia bisporula]
MFSSKSYFRTLPCPAGPRDCCLINCIFTHDKKKRSASPLAKESKASNEGDEVRVVKRRKIEAAYIELSDTDDLPAPTRKPFVGGLTSESSQSCPLPFTGSPSMSEPQNAGIAATPHDRVVVKRQPRAASLASLTRPVSPPQPPSKSGKKQALTTNSERSPANTAARREQLAPRIISKGSPAPYATRLALLKKLHEDMATLNRSVVKEFRSDPRLRSLCLTVDQLVKTAVDIEEEIARGQPMVYPNIMRQRIRTYQKMSLDDWKKERTESTSKSTPADAPKRSEAPVKTGLSLEEELSMLERFIAVQEGLSQHGYVTTPPTRSEIEEAKYGVATSANWEHCDRCGTRFQVFPDRREDGALTSGGSCTYHWGRVFTPRREKTDAITGVKEPLYSCCSNPKGTPGCMSAPTHVFKISEPKRLAAVLPFVKTPPNESGKQVRAVSFDCEMGYTCYGLELIRLSATSWPGGEALIDVLVRPIGHILDLNTRFSGVSNDHFLNAITYDPATGEPPISCTTPEGSGNQKLYMVSSPIAARALLLSIISPATPLIGHAIENDLNTIRLVHPSIVDTAILFKHPRGFPFRFGLKKLVKEHLKLDIQMAGSAGHDSLEDARSTGYLVLWKIAEEWKILSLRGWKSKNGAFYPPGKSEPGRLPLYEGFLGSTAAQGLATEKNNAVEELTFSDSKQNPVDGLTTAVSDLPCA